MTVDIERLVEEEYVLEWRRGFYNSYPTLTEAVDAVKRMSPLFLQSTGMKIRHRVVAILDTSVDCCELLGTSAKKSGFPR